MACKIKQDGYSRFQSFRNGQLARLRGAPIYVNPHRDGLVAKYWFEGWRRPELKLGKNAWALTEDSHEWKVLEALQSGGKILHELRTELDMEAYPILQAIRRLHAVGMAGFDGWRYDHRRSRCKVYVALKTMPEAEKVQPNSVSHEMLDKLLK